jgi:Tfp pilus assembly protein PilF
MERWGEAEEQYKIAMDLNPNDADIHCSYGDLLAEMERNKEAEEQYKLALKINPNMKMHTN